MQKKDDHKAAVKYFFQSNNEMIDNANTLIEKFENKWSVFAQTCVWNIGEIIHILAEYHLVKIMHLTEHPFHRIDLSHNKSSKLMNTEYSKHSSFIKKAIYRGIRRKEIVVVPGETECVKSNNEQYEGPLSNVFLTWDLVSSRLESKSVDPQSFIEFASKEGLDLPDRLLTRGLPATTLKSRRINSNHGNEALWALKHILEGKARQFIAGEVLRGCTCRHDKLAYFIYVNAKDENGSLLRDHEMKAQYNFLSSLHVLALEMVPEERQFGNPGYNPEKCKCSLPEHKFAVPRRKKT